MGSRDLSRRKKPRNVRLPPHIHRKTAVVVLGAKGYFKHFLCDVHALFAVELNGGSVHVGKALNGGAEIGLSLLR